MSEICIANIVSLRVSQAVYRNMNRIVTKCIVTPLIAWQHRCQPIIKKSLLTDTDLNMDLICDFHFDKLLWFSIYTQALCTIMGLILFFQPIVA